MFIVILLVLTIFTLNCSVAQDVDNSANVVLPSTSDIQLNQADSNSAGLIKTEIDVKSYAYYTAIGGTFKIQLLDENKTAIANQNVTFDLDGVTYHGTTDDNGTSSLKLRVGEGSYNITAAYLGNSIYAPSSKTASFTINNTRVVDEGLSSSEIQDIIDNARENNVILFNGDSYDDINLVINKSLTLISNSNIVLQSSSSGPVIKIQGRAASLTKIKGFTIKGSGTGILVNGSDYVTILSNEITAGDGISAFDTNYLNITKNSIVENGKNGIVILNDNYTYITDNTISNNGDTGILISKSNNTYIYSNSIKSNKYYGISAVDTIGGVNYGEGPENLQIVANDISKNEDTGIDIYHVKDNLKIIGNNIDSNKYYGIAMNDVGSNLIQSNVISNHRRIAIQFTEEYTRPDNQEISYNAFVLNSKHIEARETGYDEVEQLQLEDNWYSRGTICPKVKAGIIDFSVTHLGGDYFQVTFLDSNGNVASLLPDRTLSYKTDDGQTVSITVSGGTSVFKVSGVSEDIFKSSIDLTPKTADYNRDSSADISEYSGQSQQYSYPSISYGLYDGMGGSGEGDYIGEAAYGEATKGDGDASSESSDFTGNSTSSQNADPSSRASGQVNDVSQSVDSGSTTSQASASTSSGDSSSGATSGDQSVAKRIVIEDEDIFRVTGMSFIVLLILLTIAYYYKDDIKEMKSKM